MSTPFYRPILKRAYEVTIRHKFLWALGFFAALLGGGGDFEFAGSLFTGLSAGEIGLDNWLLSFAQTTRGNPFVLFQRALTALSAAEYVTLIIFFVLFLVFIWLSVGAQGMLIYATSRIEQNGGPQSSAAHIFGAAKRTMGATLLAMINRTNASFGHILALLLSTRLLALFLLTVIGVPLFALISQFYPAGAMGIFRGLLFVLGAPLFVISSIVGKYAIAYHTIEGKPWRQALSSAMLLFKNHWLLSLETAVLLFAVSVIAGIAFVLFLLFLAIPLLLLGLLLTQIAAISVVQAFAWGALVVFFFMVLLFGSMLFAYQFTSWAVLYMQIRKHGPHSKIIRTVQRWQKQYGTS